MNDWLELLAALPIFLVGLQLSAFFSGSETGFYRVNSLRLAIDAQRGDPVAKRLLWFAKQPSYFVATTLVGNNVANYLTTFAIGLASVSLFRSEADWVEVGSTLLLSPVVFLFGELMPKNLYFRAPNSLLRRGSLPFLVFFRLFFVVSYPLILMARLLEWLGGGKTGGTETMLGRKRLVQVFNQGQREGILTAVQGQLVQGLLNSADRPIAESITPASRILGVEESASREDVLSYARRFGLTHVAVRKDGTTDEWFGYIRVADAAIVSRPLQSLIRPMAQFARKTRKLEAMLKMQETGTVYGCVYEGRTFLGTISERGLIEQLMRPPQTAVAATRPAADFGL